MPKRRAKRQGDSEREWCFSPWSGDPTASATRRGQEVCVRYRRSKKGRAEWDGKPQGVLGRCAAGAGELW